jgi:hypothetical protein
MYKLEDVLTLPTGCLVVLLAVVTLLLRRLIEALNPSLSKDTPATRGQRVWEMFCLPALPAALGTLFCSVVPPRMYPYPAVAMVTPLSLATYGFTLGWFSSGGYRAIAALLQRKWNVAIPGGSDPPPPIPAAALGGVPVRVCSHCKTCWSPPPEPCPNCHEVPTRRDLPALPPK